MCVVVVFSQIVAAAVLACAAAAPSGALLAPYGHGLGLAHGGLAVAHGAPLGLAHGGLAVAHAAPLAVAHAVAPTIPPGDIAGAAIDAHVEAVDHARAIGDQASEIHGQALNAAEDHAWQAVDAAQTAQAQVDGAAAGVAPNVARQLVGHGAVAHAAIAAPALAHGALVGPALAHGALAGPALAHGALVGSALAHGYAGSHSVATSSLSQTHPAPIVHAPIAYGAHGLGHGLAHGLAHAW